MEEAIYGRILPNSKETPQIKVKPKFSSFEGRNSRYRTSKA
jgi:hypothetical protein